MMIKKGTGRNLGPGHNSFCRRPRWNQEPREELRRGLYDLPDDKLDSLTGTLLLYMSTVRR